MQRLTSSLYRLFYPAKDPEALKRAYGIPETVEFQFELRPDGWMVLTSEQLPGLITEGRNPEELLEMFNDAVLTYFNVPRRDADIVFPTIQLSGIGTVSRQKTPVLSRA